MRRRGEPSREAAYKLFLLAPRSRGRHPVGVPPFYAALENGGWETLLREAPTGAACRAGRSADRFAGEAVREEACEGCDRASYAANMCATNLHGGCIGPWQC